MNDNFDLNSNKSTNINNNINTTNANTNANTTTKTSKIPVKGLAWLMQILSGAILVILLTYHILVTHLFGSLKLNSVLSRVHSLWLFYFIFLIFVVFHAFNGLSTIAYEYGKRKLSKALYVAMIFAAVYGLILLNLLNSSL